MRVEAKLLVVPVEDVKLYDEHIRQVKEEAVSVDCRFDIALGAEVSAPLRSEGPGDLFFQVFI